MLGARIPQAVKWLIINVEGKNNQQDCREYVNGSCSGLSKNALHRFVHLNAWCAVGETALGRARRHSLIGEGNTGVSKDHARQAKSAFLCLSVCISLPLPLSLSLFVCLVPVGHK